MRYFKDKSCCCAKPYISGKCNNPAVHNVRQQKAKPSTTNSNPATDVFPTLLVWYMILYYIWYAIIYLTAIGLTPGGSSTVHIYTQTIHRRTQSTQTIQRTTQLTNQEECGPCSVFACYTLPFALQLRKKQGKPSVRVAGECQLAKNIQDREYYSCFHSCIFVTGFPKQKKKLQEIFLFFHAARSGHANECGPVVGGNNTWEKFLLLLIHRLYIIFSSGYRIMWNSILKQ